MRLPALKSLTVTASLIALSSAFAGTSLWPAASAEEITTSRYAMPETESWQLTASDGQVYAIHVSRPEGEAPPGGYPVLYILDGNAMFAGFAEARRIQSVYGDGLDKMIVVGIGYPGEYPYDPRRMLDFTAPIETPALKALYADYPAGGRDRFVSFLLDELRPEIAARYTTSEYRQSLFGHSLGGLLALHVLYSRPGAFHTIIAASPSIWWDNQSILREEKAYASAISGNDALGRASRVLLLVGEREETAVTVADSKALARRLEALSAHGLRSELQVLDDETHVSVPSRAVTPTLRAAMQWP